ncbi:MAG: hypothetical protein JW894_08510 [Bacteroidales bacterium]|nr:hypothetical protein [Bacteroidales bacterium]
MKKTKSLLTLLSLATIIMVTSCDLVEKLTDFSFESGYNVIPFTVYPSDAGIYTFVDTVLMSDLEELADENGGDIDNISEATISETLLEVTDPGRTLDGFAWGEVYMSTNEQPEKLVAWGENFAVGATSVNLNVSQDDIKAMLKDDAYYIRCVGELSEDLLETIHLVIKFKYEAIGQI